jgi:hypothetical protein
MHAHVFVFAFVVELGLLLRAVAADYLALRSKLARVLEAKAV